jgi:hypothetical protein
MAQSKAPVSHYWIFVSGRRTGYWDRSEEDTTVGFDIFRKLRDGSPVWVTHAPTLREAQVKLDTLARTLPAEYFIRDSATAEIVAHMDVDTSEEIESGDPQ